MKKILSILGALALAAGCSKSTENKAAESNASTSEAVQGQMLVRFEDGASESDKKRVLDQFAQSEVVSEALHIYAVKDSMLNGNEQIVSDRISKDSAVAYAEPNFKRRMNQDVTQDKYFMKLWGLKNFGQDAPNGIEGVEGADIGVTRAWLTSKGSKSVKVAVLDTGCWYKHPDLAENIWVNQAEKDGQLGVDDDKNGYTDDLHGWNAVSDAREKKYYGKVGSPDPLDDQGHGTHVSGTIGAVRNSIGVVGVNQTVSIACVKFLDENGSGSALDEARAIEYIRANDFDIVSGSYGGGAESKTERDIIELAVKEGKLFVFAAGNDSSNNDVTKSFPATYDVDGIIAVAATDSRDQIADFSNFGQKTVDIAAPGVNIISTVPPTVGAEELEPYATWSGTSMATPHVSGAAALLIAAVPELKKQPLKIKERLMATADFKPQLASLVASGRLNIGRAIANETAGNPLRTTGWQEVPMIRETVQYPDQKVDSALEIKVAGAKAIQIHMTKYQIEEGFDSAVLYDGDYRPAMILSGINADVWSPVILGDKAYLKFSNAMVSIAGGAPFANFNSMGVQIDKVKVLK